MHDPEFWHKKWEMGQIGFHQETYHPWLNTYWAALDLPPETPVFVPLCGKSKDMIYLRAQGHPIIGVELNAYALACFARENKLDLNWVEGKPMRRMEGAGYTLFQGDFFKLGRKELFGMRAVYDRAALIALPADLREKYVQHLQTFLMPSTKIFLITLEYDENQASGPPFCVSEDNVSALYGSWCEIEKITHGDAEAFRGTTATPYLYIITVK